MWGKSGFILRNDDVVSDFFEKKSSQRWDIIIKWLADKIFSLLFKSARYIFNQITYYFALL